ncbi:NAD-binding protein [Mobiluncus curtisii]|uniref:RCK N-terminal domain-containing protein n=1 Tax=Mobiluncus curtisii TaxID=2051 RepID=A0A2X3BAT1_9ACTO|nr:NAD-binding protein [Mobiluncus curtisii]SQC02278.1 Uncharacterised protein [Mobiluncus curtisii]
MGCGRVGTTLAKAIEDRGHTLAIIDNNTESFRRLYKNFQGQKLTGEGYDRNTPAPGWHRGRLRFRGGG